MPAWLQGPNGLAHAGETGGMLDDQRDRLLQGVLARFPTKGSLVAGAFGLPPSAALDNIGADRMLPRAPAEADAAYAARELAAWDTWAFAGSHFGVLQALRIAGFDTPLAILVQENGRYSRLTGTAGTSADVTFGTLAVRADTGRPGWTFDYQTDKYHRFALVYTSMPSGAGGLSTDAGKTRHNALVKTWKPAKALFSGTYVITGARIWGFAAAPPALPSWGVGNWGGSSTFISPDL